MTFVIYSRHTGGANYSVPVGARPGAYVCVCIVSFIHPRWDGLELPQRSTRVRDTTDQQDFRTACAKTPERGECSLCPIFFEARKTPTGKPPTAKALGVVDVGAGETVLDTQGSRREAVRRVFGEFPGRSPYSPLLALRRGQGTMEGHCSAGTVQQQGCGHATRTP